MKTSRVYLEDMLSFAKKAVSFASEGLSEEPDMRRLAFERCFEIIGEAAGRVPPEIVAAFPDVAFREAIDMRNRVIHGYDSLSLSILQKTAERDLPLLIAALETALTQPLPDEP